MSVHPEERRIAGLLRELIVQSGTTLEMVEKYLGWKPGRLADRLDGKVRLSFEDVLEILPLLNATPADFFAWLYGFDPKEAVVAGTLAQQGTDRRFDSSLRVVKDAVSRRAAWKQERSQDKKPD
ncbi:MAG TPA: hypothetical protein VE685_09615 [Thermoanaerobaculia bacterium]|nr:hypothetical protein [Thermoanaerobaculia bacterium]